MGTLMKTSLLALAMLASSLSFTYAAEPTSEAMAVPGPTGAAMAATCAGCHGTEGRLGTVEFMPLAGMPEAEFIRAMDDYRSGKRQSTLMGNLAKGFSKREVAAMARYFARVDK